MNVGRLDRPGCTCSYKDTGSEYEPTIIVYLERNCIRHGHIFTELETYTDFTKEISIELLEILESKPIGF